MGKLANMVMIAAGSFVAGILLAPKSGKDTRRDLMNRANNYKSKASDSLDQVKKGADSVKNEVAEGAESIKNEVAKRAKSVKEDIAETSKDVQRSTR